MNEYEKQRLENIKHNNKTIEELKIKYKVSDLSTKRPRLSLERNEKFLASVLPSYSTSTQHSGGLSNTTNHSRLSSTSRQPQIDVLLKKRPVLHDNDVEETSDSDTESDGQSVPSQPIKKKGRGRAKMLKSWGNVRLNVEFNELYQPIGENAAILATQMGRTVKNGKMFPLTVRDWRKMDAASKDTTWLEYKANFTLEEDYKKEFLKRLGHQWKEWKAHVKKNYFLKYKDDDEELSVSRPLEVDYNQWLELIEYWNTESSKRISAKKQKVAPRTGKSSFAVVKDKMAKEKGEDPSCFDFWMATHVESAKTPLDKKTQKFVKKLTGLISKNPEAMKSKESRDELLIKLLEPEKSGQMRSYGFGPSKTQVQTVEKQKMIFDNKLSSFVDAVREGLKEEFKAEIHDMVKDIVVDLFQTLMKNKCLDDDALSD